MSRTSPPRSRPGRRPGPGQDPAPSSRDKILEVAEALFARRGLSGVGLREVADEVGVSKSTLFHHFRSKVQLYLEVLLRVLDRMHERLAPSLAAGRRAPEKLEAWLDALIDALADHPTTARLLLRGLVEDEEIDAEGEDLAAVQRVEAAIGELVGEFQMLVRQGIDEGDFRRVSVPQVTQTLIGATVFHFASGEFGESLLGAPIYSAESVRRCKQEVSAFLRHGLAAPGTATALTNT